MTGDIQQRCENYLSIESDTMESTLHFPVSIRSFIAGLACYHIYRETRDPSWLERGKTRKEKMRRYSEEGCKYNFLQKYLLMQAEESYCIGDYDAAREYYKNAIATCQNHQSCRDEALVCELAGRHYLNTGDTNTSLEYFSTAEVKYREFGAEGKANDVRNTIHSVLQEVVLGSESLS
jgi:tetratricopeptide (TPR) repeat protein